MEQPKKRIAFLADGLYPVYVGGMQRHSTALVKEFIRLGHEVHVFFEWNHSKEKLEELKQYFNDSPGVVLHPVPFPTGIWYPGHYIVRSYQFSKRISKLLLQFPSFDYIYAQGFTSWHLGKQRKKNKNKAGILAVNLHGLNMFQPTVGLKQRFQQRLLRIPAYACMKNSDLIISLGGRLTEIILNMNLRVNVVEVPAGIDNHWLVNSVKPNHRPLRFLFVGRNDKIKAFPVLLEACRRLRKKGIISELHVVGNIDETEVGELGVVHGLILNENRLREIYASCDVLVCPSVSEGMPIAILEAMSSGLMVIASDTGAIRTQIDTASGILIKPADVADLTRAMERVILMGDDEILAMKKAALCMVKKKFMWNEIAVSTMHYLNNVSVSNTRISH